MLRLEYWKVDPEGMRAAVQLSAHLARSGIDRALLDLVYLRISQMNGCSYCVDTHARDAVAHGLDQRLVNDVAAWRDVPFFDERQRAALAWSEAVTDIAGTRAPDDVYRAAAQHFSEKELVGLTLAAAHMNALNRIAIAFRRGPAAGPGASGNGLPAAAAATERSGVGDPAP
jgi:AhpD family alkylhydroperoxidase